MTPWKTCRGVMQKGWTNVCHNKKEAPPYHHYQPENAEYQHDDTPNKQNSNVPCFCSSIFELTMFLHAWWPLAKKTPRRTFVLIRLYIQITENHTHKQLTMASIQSLFPVSTYAGSGGSHFFLRSAKKHQNKLSSTNK